MENRDLTPQRVVEPLLDVAPHRAIQRLVMMRGGNHDQAFWTSEGREYPARMLGRRLGISCSVNQQHGNVDAGRRRDRADRVHIEIPLSLCEAEGALDQSRGENERRALGCDGAQIRECLGRYNRAYSRIVSGFLERHCGSERGPDEHDRLGRERIDDAMQIAFLEEAVSARGAFRIPVRAAIVGDDVEALRRKAADDTV